ncbi:Cof-type HAD-IIB family hydrolase [Erysipelothrix rhusiopathiae]|uniref:Cof-type HAD-IIB family hydrolase n=1 Tax=unclassified Erysipelothrix TaxID=2624170 RepID=UPI001379091A|nr:Cof-type HAD-IIB family hydrolase [Erysipelothrix sp. strain 2 (EsS2-7-Brazil)]MBK2403287.1 HAD family phosphatase [Erysipelothrix sp. strain 2 (EsS2-7-Brazil)]NBA00745.1 Cof-type HAD-IIB family hydrolase [Erysipelothrix rhusiopathiae]
MIKLIASDIDGTLLNSEHVITDRTREVIHAARNQGYEFMLATGRNYESAAAIAEALGLDPNEIPIVSLNGMRVEHPIRNYKAIEPPMSYEACERMEALGTKYFMGILYCFDDIIYFQMDSKSEEDFVFGEDEDRLRFFSDGTRVSKINHLDDIHDRFEKGDSILKIVYIQNVDYTELVKERIAFEMESDFDLLMVAPGWAEIMPKRINKGDAIMAYAASRGIQPNEIICFGDSDNDLTMIKQSGIGVAMENARHTLKIVADTITRSNDENGVAEYIAEHLIDVNVL